MARSSYRGPCPLDCKVYVGDLGTSGDRRELEDAFGRYGPLRNVWVARNPPGFAFVEYEDPRDAEDSAREMDGRTLCGRRVRVELSSGRTKPKRFGGGDREGGGRYDERDRRRGGGGGDRGGRVYDRGYDRAERNGGREERGGGRERSRSRSPRENNVARRRSRSPVKRERSRSGSPAPTRVEENSRRRGRAAVSEEKNGSPNGGKE